MTTETLEEAAQALADAVGAFDNQNMPFSRVRAARERVLTALLTFTKHPICACRNAYTGKPFCTDRCAMLPEKT